MRVDLVSGEEYTYLVQHEDTVVAGYELVSGVFTASSPVGTGGTIARTKVIKSTAGVGEKYSWPDTATKRIAVTARGAQLTQYVLQCVELPPGQGILIAGTGQSGIAWKNYMESPTLGIEARVRDWSTAGVAPFSRSNLEWRSIDPDDVYRDQEVFYVGYGRSYATGSPEVVSQSAQITNEFAKGLAFLMNRDMYTVNVTSNGTQIDDASAGWLYDPGSGNTAEVFAEEVENAIAALAAARSASPQTLPASADGITFPHFVLFNQGESDMNAGMSSSRWARLASNFIRDCYDPNKYAIANPIATVFLVFEVPADLKNQFPTFNGHSVLEHITDNRVRLITSGTEQTYDGLHRTGESTRALAQRAALSVVTGQYETSPGGIVHARRKGTALEGTPFVQWAYQGDITSSPLTVAAGTFGHNAARTEFYLSKTMGGIGSLPASDVSEAGYHTLGEFMTVMTFGDTASSDSITFQFNTLPEDMGNFWKWDLLSASTTSPEMALTSPMTTCDVVCNREIFDETQYIAYTDMPYGSAAYLPDTDVGPAGAAKTDFSTAYFDTTGSLIRSGAGATRFAKVETTGASTQLEIGDVSSAIYNYADVVVVAKNETTQELFVAEIKFGGRSDGVTWTKLFESVTYVYAPTSPTFTFTIANVLFIGTWSLTVDALSSGVSPEHVWTWNIRTTDQKVIDV